MAPTGAAAATKTCLIWQERVVDSLLNFETVKVLGGERREAARFDELTSRLMRLQTSAQDSLSWLNWGQTIAMQLGMCGGLLVACARVTGGQGTSVGDFVMVQLYIVQLFAPLANLGGSYRMFMQVPPPARSLGGYFGTRHLGSYRMSMQMPPALSPMCRCHQPWVIFP